MQARPGSKRLKCSPRQTDDAIESDCNRATGAGQPAGRYPEPDDFRFPLSCLPLAIVPRHLVGGRGGQVDRAFEYWPAVAGSYNLEAEHYDNQDHLIDVTFVDLELTQPAVVYYTNIDSEPTWQSGSQYVVTFFGVNLGGLTPILDGCNSSEYSVTSGWSWDGVSQLSALIDVHASAECVIELDSPPTSPTLCWSRRHHRQSRSFSTGVGHQRNPSGYRRTADQPERVVGRPISAPRGPFPARPPAAGARPTQKIGTGTTSSEPDHILLGRRRKFQNRHRERPAF